MHLVKKVSKLLDHQFLYKRRYDLCRSEKLLGYYWAPTLNNKPKLTKKKIHLLDLASNPVLSYIPYRSLF